MTVQTQTPAMTATPSASAYWLSFVIEWERLADAAFEAGQNDMSEFFGELADDASDVWSGVYGPLSSN